MKISREKVLQALSTVEDPDLKKDLVTLNMIEDIELGVGQIKFSVVLTTPACPLKELIKNNCIKAIEKEFGKGVLCTINMTSSVTTQRVSNSPLLPNVKNIIAISSGKGGVGKSTVTANLAVALARNGAKVGIVDADIFGPSIPTLFNVEREQPQVKQKDGKNLLIPLENYGVKLISIGLLTPPESAIVWRGPMASSALKQFFSDVQWGELDYMLIDLPPGTSDIHLTMVQSVPVTGAVVITTPQKVALADARKGLAMFSQGQINVEILGVIENMSYFTPEELPDNKYYLFGKGGGRKLAEESNVPFLGEIPLVQSIRESADAGYPITLKEESKSAKAFMDLAGTLAQKIAMRNADKAKAKTVKIKT